MTPAVRTAVPGDLGFLADLQARNRHALGFLPWTALRQYLDKSRALLVDENGSPAGYLLTLPSGKIVQAAVSFDARRRYLATALLARYLSQLVAARVPCVSCWCAEDLEANAFWSESGFVHAATRDLRHAGRLRRTHRYWHADVKLIGSPLLRP